jgi:hypothetical protein
MSKRLLEIVATESASALEQLASQHQDVWSNITDLLPPQNLYMFKLVSKSLRELVTATIASLGPLCVLMWKRCRKCGRGWAHLCGFLPSDPCFTNQPVRPYLSDNLHVRLDIAALKSWRYDATTNDWCLEFAVAFCPNWGHGSTLARDRYQLSSETGKLSYQEGEVVLESDAVTHAALHWRSVLEKRARSALEHHRVAKADAK